MLILAQTIFVSPKLIPYRFGFRTVDNYEIASKELKCELSVWALAYKRFAKDFIARKVGELEERGAESSDALRRAAELAARKLQSNGNLLKGAAAAEASCVQLKPVDDDNQASDIIGVLRGEVDCKA